MFNEFPNRFPKNTNKLVGINIVRLFPKMSLYEVLEITRRKKDFSINAEFPLGYVHVPEEARRRHPFIEDFVCRFGKRIKLTPGIHYIYYFGKRYSIKDVSPVYVMEFGLLFIGYRLFKKDAKQFWRILAAAKTKKEFCILAGLS